MIRKYYLDSAEESILFYDKALKYLPAITKISRFGFSIISTQLWYPGCPSVTGNNEMYVFYCYYSNSNDTFDNKK